MSETCIDKLKNAVHLLRIAVEEIEQCRSPQLSMILEGIQLQIQWLDKEIERWEEQDELIRGLDY